MYEDILYDTNEGTATITINRPKVRNAVRPRTYEELTDAMKTAADDPEVGVVVLTGSGDKAFSSGGDVSDQSTRKPYIGRAHMRRLFALSSTMRMMDKPIIAKVRGFCVGGGNEINLFCDMTIASEDAKFGQVGPRVGSVPIWGACQLLARYVGERKAREMIYTCRLYTARVEAHETIDAVPKNSISATDVMVTASGLLKAVDLAVFELGMWQSWTGR